MNIDFGVFAYRCEFREVTHMFYTCGMKKKPCSEKNCPMKIKEETCVWTYVDENSSGLSKFLRTCGTAYYTFNKQLPKHCPDCDKPIEMKK